MSDQDRVKVLKAEAKSETATISQEEGDGAGDYVELGPASRETQGSIDGKWYDGAGVGRFG